LPRIRPTLGRRPAAAWWIIWPAGSC
ncbi:uncharacterized protein METZ01_LOCUS141179, partial [marine metagenome]